MGRVNRGGALFALLAAVFAVALCAAPTQAHASGRNVEFKNEDGSSVLGTVTLDDDNLLVSNTPTPSKTGWDFVGWWTEPVTWYWWNDGTDIVDFYKSPRPNPPAGYENDPIDNHAYTFDGDYWTFLGKTSGHQVKVGDQVNVDKLYACFKPKTYTVKFHWNGWEDSTGALQATRDYGTTATLPMSPRMGSTWKNKSFDGWYTNGNVKYTGKELITGNLDLYAHYTGMSNNLTDEDINHRNDTKYAATYITITASTNRIDAKGGKVELTAKPNMESSTYVPDYNNIKWAIKSGSEFVTIGSASGSYCTVTSRNAGSGQAEIEASFINGKGEKLTATITIEVIEHKHTWKDAVTTPANCQHSGSGTRTCTICGAKETFTIAKTDHTYKTETKAPTCAEAGYEKSVCSVCGNVGSNKVLEKVDHDFEIKSVKSCSGTATTMTCKVCGFTKMSTEPGNGEHAWETTKTVDQPATCGQAGSKSIHCSKCEVTKDSEPIPATGEHVFGGWHTTKVASATEKGIQERICVTCGLAETQEIPALVSGATTPNDTTPDTPANSDNPTAPDTPSTSDDPDKPDTPDVSDTPDAPEAPGTPDTPDTPDAPSTENPEQPGGTTTTEATVYRLYNPYSHEHLITTDANEAKELGGAGWNADKPCTYTMRVDEGDVKVYRLYNPNNGDHMYTTDENEYNTLQTYGWTGEGVKLYGALEQTEGSVPVYRLFNPWQNRNGGAGSHLWTEDANEYQQLQDAGWQGEGVKWYGYPASL